MRIREKKAGPYHPGARRPALRGLRIAVLKGITQRALRGTQERRHAPTLGLHIREFFEFDFFVMLADLAWVLRQALCDFPWIDSRIWTTPKFFLFFTRKTGAFERTSGACLVYVSHCEKASYARRAVDTRHSIGYFVTHKVGFINFTLSPCDSFGTFFSLNGLLLCGIGDDCKTALSMTLRTHFTLDYRCCKHGLIT